MPVYGLAPSRRGFTFTDDQGLRIAEIAGTEPAISAAVERIRSRRDVVLVVDEEVLRESAALARVLGRGVALCIVPTEVLAAARELVGLRSPSPAKTAALLARLPSVPWLAGFLRRADPAPESQLLLL